MTTGRLQVGYPSGQVDIPALAEVGSNVTRTADAVEKAYSAQADAMAPESTLTGWATGAVLPDATHTWATFVTNLAAQVRTFGADLTTASTDYRRTDDEAAKRVATAGTGLPAGHLARAGGHGQPPQ